MNIKLELIPLGFIYSETIVLFLKHEIYTLGINYWRYLLVYEAVQNQTNPSPKKK